MFIPASLIRRAPGCATQSLIDAGAFEDRTPIFVGGTGLYFRALVEGFSQMPEIPQATRDRWRCKLSEEGPMASTAF
jgi:tRNA A37 N6-isopentenylltransferase MiaA